MSYTKKYFLQRVKAVNEVYLKCHKQGMFNEYIYQHHIKWQFHISRSTFYEYLTIPYAAQLKEIERREAAEKEQNPRLFDEH
ncbi:MAG: hypothetical protein NC038_05590 [Paludibacter sp.]|nr:hypothetical protein [Bacteroidales bacterium]MCM1069845.1 hypothetical protein [Prevotella sp.]MCM1353962.1 hypothetical protein [Bacteroides sp.]MCM1443396.1 hypothetical protein [Muribaculum sp.]MCM1482099.1 hypothetical protein [Paludibacter sp.]